MRCENCGQVLTPQSDPLCRACLHELRAGPYEEDGPEERSTLSRIDAERLRRGDGESAA